MTLIIFFCLIFLTVAVIVLFIGLRSKKHLQTNNYQTNCNVCGKPSVNWNKYFCSFECEAQLAQNMPDFYKRLDTD